MTLDELAAAAEEQARRDHGLSLDSLDVADRILRAESAADPGRLETLAACYGAWLGQRFVRRGVARWVGLSEPAPPRLDVGGILVSPIDAARRRVLDPSAPSLMQISAQLEAWARPAPPALESNRAAWDALGADPRFIGGEVPDPGEALDPWLRAEGVRGKDLLCLGAGGGRHGPLLARAGAKVTVVDLSERQLDHDRRALIRTLCASIDDLGPLDPASFDIVLQPVSACYVPDVGRVYTEVARVLRPGGLYVVQHKQPAALQANREGTLLERPCAAGLALPSREEPGATEYIHPLESLLGGLCRAGFVIEDVSEPPRADALAPPGSPAHRAWYVPPYLKLKARLSTQRR